MALVFAVDGRRDRARVDGGEGRNVHEPRVTDLPRRCAWREIVPSWIEGGCALRCYRPSPFGSMSGWTMVSVCTEAHPSLSANLLQGGRLSSSDHMLVLCSDLARFGQRGRACWEADKDELVHAHFDNKSSKSTRILSAQEIGRKIRSDIRHGY